MAVFTCSTNTLESTIAALELTRHPGIWIPFGIFFPARWRCTKGENWYEKGASWPLWNDLNKLSCLHTSEQCGPQFRSELHRISHIFFSGLQFKYLPSSVRDFCIALHWILKASLYPSDPPWYLIKLTVQSYYHTFVNCTVVVWSRKEFIWHHQLN